jgi:ribosomal-protein-alanine N-acetyltransferase
MLQTEHLLLRPLIAEDRHEFVRVHETSAQHFGPWMPSADPEQSLDYFFDMELAVTDAEIANGSGLRLAGLTADGCIAGFFSLTQIFRGAFQNAYAAWRVSADQIGRGLATEGVLGLLDLAFEESAPGLSLHRVQANIIPSNLASIRVAEKAGFRREGTATAYLKIDGRWQDHHMFAKICDEHTPIYIA